MGGQNQMVGPQNTEIKPIQEVQDLPERKSEGKTSRAIGYSYSVPFFLAAGWYLYLSMLYQNKVSGEAVYNTISAVLSASKITLPSVADNYLQYFIKDLWFADSFTNYYLIHGGISLVLLLQGLFLFNVSYCRINQHSYTALAFGHFPMRSLFRSVIESCKGITALVMAGISAPMISLHMVTSPTFISQGLLTPLVGISGKEIYSLPVDYINYVLALTVLAPLPAVIVGLYSFLTLIIKICAYPYPDRPSRESIWKFGALFAIFFTLVVVFICCGLFGFAAASLMSTYFGMSISAQSSGQAPATPEGQVGVVWMASKGILGLLYNYPIIAQTTQWILIKAAPARGQDALPSRDELIQAAEVKIAEKERIQFLKQKTIENVISHAVNSKKQMFVEKAQFINKISNEVNAWKSRRQQASQNSVFPLGFQPNQIETPKVSMPNIQPLQAVPNPILPGGSIKEITQPGTQIELPYQQPANPELSAAQVPSIPDQAGTNQMYSMSQIDPPPPFAGPNYTDYPSDSRFAVPEQTRNKQSLLGGDQQYYSQRNPPDLRLPNIGQPQNPNQLNRLPSRFPLLQPTPQTFTTVQNRADNSQQFMTEENLLPEQTDDYTNPLATNPDEQQPYYQEPNNLSPILEVSPSQEVAFSNPTSPAMRQPAYQQQQRRDSLATQPSISRGMQPRAPPNTKLPKYVPGRPTKMQPPTIPVQVGRGPLRIPEGYQFSNPRLGGR